VLLLSKVQWSPKKKIFVFLGWRSIIIFLKIIILSSKKKRAGMLSRYDTRVVTDMIYVFFYSFFFKDHGSQNGT
jgi:hypothetical protein